MLTGRLLALETLRGSHFVTPDRMNAPGPSLGSADV
jgi:hypothetical protein